MLLSILMALFIGIYILWILWRKIKDLKEGRYCQSGCDGCTRNCISKVKEK